MAATRPARPVATTKVAAARARRPRRDVVVMRNLSSSRDFRERHPAAARRAPPGPETIYTGVDGAVGRAASRVRYVADRPGARRDEGGPVATMADVARHAGVS